MNDEKLLAEFPVLETDRLILRKLTESDAGDVFEYACEPEVASYLIWEPHMSINDSLDFIKFAENEFQNNSSIIWGIVIKDERKLIGTIDLRGFSNLHKCGEVGYAISQKYWGRGIVTEAFKALIDFGFGKLNLNRIESHCEHENTGSWKVMEKVGLKYEGTLREKVFMKNKFRTMKMYSILKSEWVNNAQN